MLEPESQYTKNAEFFAGMKAILPLVVGAIPFGIIFGALASTTGLSAWATQGMSLLVFAGSAQFIAATLIADGTGLVVIIFTTMIVNLRHMLYAATLAPHVKNLPQRWLLPMGFLLTDESFAASIQRFRRDDLSPNKHWFYLGAAVLMYSNWQVSTFIGIIAGRLIDDPLRWGLDFAMIVTFIGMTIPMITSRSVLGAAATSGVTALLLRELPHKLGLISAALAGVAVGVALHHILKEKETPEYVQPD